MAIKEVLRYLEKKGLISRKPKPWIPFLLALTYFLYWYLLDMHQPLALRWLERFMLYAAYFAILYAVIHWAIVMILEKE